MTPFYFGSNERRIFGIYEPAAFGGGGNRAAVLCSPWGPEYLFAHRTMRQLAGKLSAAGFHSLRFDFFGTGDSAGDWADADMAGWETDVETALEEIRDMVGTVQVALIGMRLGATIAASVAARLPNDIDALVLWDPVLSGAEYLASLGVAAPPGSERALEVKGFPLTDAMWRDLRTIDLAPSLSSPPVRTLMVLTDPLPSHAALHDRAGGNRVGSLAIETMTAVRPWIEDPANVGMVPFAAIQRIIAWLG